MRVLVRGGAAGPSGTVTDAGLLREPQSEVDAVCHQAAVTGHGLDPAPGHTHTVSDLASASAHTYGGPARRSPVAAG